MATTLSGLLNYIADKGKEALGNPSWDKGEPYRAALGGLLMGDLQPMRDLNKPTPVDPNEALNVALNFNNPMAMSGLLGGVIKGVGNPTVYHGTNKTFDKFNVGGDGGIYFTDLLDRAAGIGKNVIPAKLKMNNPLNLKGQDSFTSDLVTKYDNDLFKAMSDGYDGVIDGDTYIVFSPDQIERLDSSALPWKDDPLALMGLLGGR